MQQEFMSVKFILTEIVYKTLRFISFSNFEFSLLHFEDFPMFSSLFIYMNNIFDELKIFDDMFKFLRDYFFFRIEWLCLKLSFKTLKLLMNRIKRLNVVHVIEEQIYIVSERIEKIARWSMSINSIEIKAFFEVVNIIRKWVKNFIEIVRSLIKLIEKTN